MKFFIIILLLNCFVENILGENYYAKYFLREKNITVECVGSIYVEPHCINIHNKSQMFVEKTLFEIDQPVTRNEYLSDTSDRHLSSSSSSSSSASTASSATTVVHNLVLLVEFSNHRSRRKRFPVQNYHDLFNSNGTDDLLFPTGSVATFFRKQSYNKIIVESTILPWYESNFTDIEVSGGCSALCFNSKLTDVISEALRYFDVETTLLSDLKKFDSDNDGFVDLLTVITSSRGAETGYTDDLGIVNVDRVWSHRWSLFRPYCTRNAACFRVYNVNPSLFGNGNSRDPPRITRIGVLTHEISHVFGLPDLYDTDGSSSGLHVYGLMASSWGVNGDQFFPPSFSPWSKEMLKLVRFNQVEEGWNMIHPSNIEKDDQMYKLQLSKSECIYIDYQLPIENMELHPDGVLVYHYSARTSFGNRREWYPTLFKDNKYPKNNHYSVRLVQADGKFKLEKEQFPLRKDPSSYFGIFNVSDTIVLSDFGDNNINTWENLEKLIDHKCVRLGHQLGPFRRKDANTFEFYYHMNKTVSGTKCDEEIKIVTLRPTEQPTAFLSEDDEDEQNNKSGTVCSKITMTYPDAINHCTNNYPDKMTLCTRDEILNFKRKNCDRVWILNTGRENKKCDSNQKYSYRISKKKINCRRETRRNKFICCE